jgi:hypothetical protein
MLINIDNSIYFFWVLFDPLPTKKLNVLIYIVVVLGCVVVVGCVREKREVLKGRSVMTKGLGFAQQVSSSSQGVHLL